MKEEQGSVTSTGARFGVSVLDCKTHHPQKGIGGEGQRSPGREGSMEGGLSNARLHPERVGAEQ